MTRITRLLLSGFIFAQFCFAQLEARGPAPTADEIIARNLQARGGLDHWQAIHSMRLTRHVSFRATDGAAGQYDEIFEVKRPNLMRFEKRIPQGTLSLTTFDGVHGWFASWSAPKAVEVSGDVLKDLMRPVSDRLEGEFVEYAKKGYRVEPRGLQKSQGKDCYGLITTDTGGKQTYRCFDAQTFLDVEIRDETSTSLRSDFRSVENVKLPFRTESSSAAGSITIVLSSAEVNPKIEDTDFRKPSDLKPPPLADVLQSSGVTAEQVRAARRQITEAIQQVRTCAARLGVPACSFSSQPARFTFTQTGIRFWAPANTEWGGPRWAFINLDAVPKLEPKLREGWRILDQQAMYMSFDPAEKNYDKSATNILFDRPRLEWPVNSPGIKKFLEALEYLKANARSGTDAEAGEMARFHERALAWRALAEKPALPEGVHREEVLAKNSLQADQNPEAALAHFEKGLAIEPLWPAGQLGAATICGELQRYDCAALHAERFLELVPEGQQSDVLRDKLIIWKDKLGKE